MLVARVPLPRLPARSVCVAVTVTAPSAKVLTFVPAGPFVQVPPAAHVGAGVTVMLPILTLTGRPISVQVPLVT